MTQNIPDRIKHIKLSVNTVPIALFFISFLAFGLLASRLGFYGDEWNLIFEYATRGAKGVAEYLYYDGHPTATWSYIASFQLLGINPTAWQLYNLVWRWLSIVGFWLVLKQLWPERRLEGLMAAVFFGLYPQFYMESSHAVSYFEVWMGYFWLWMSFWFSLKAIRQPEKRALFMLIAIAFQIAQMFTSEYTWGTELIRPLILWFAMSDMAVAPEKLKKVFTVYWPHLLLSIGLFGWRIFLYQSPVTNRAQPKLLDSFLRFPWETLQNTISSLSQDIVLMLFSSWQKLVQPALFDLTLRSNLLEILLAAVTALACWWYLKHLALGDDQKQRWLFPALCLGGAALLFGLIPFYVAGYNVHSGDAPSNGRFVLGSLPGIALLTTLLLSFFVDATGKRFVLFALLVGLMVGWQFNAANESRKLWTVQEQFYRQLAWRAPVIAPNTALISTEVLQPLYMSRSVVFALNTLYVRPQPDNQKLNTWFFEFSGTTLGGWKLTIPGDKKFGSFVAGMDLKDEKYTSAFSGNSRQALYLSYRPDLDRCLWLITVDQTSAISGSIFQPLAKINAFQRISAGSGATPVALTQIFGPDTTWNKNWCYFFEKADLARQSADWSSVRSLWSAAEANSVQPSDGMEYFPFIEAYTWSGDWSTALKLGQAARQTTRNIEPALCAFWSRLTKGMPALAKNRINQKRINEAFACQP